MFSNILGVFRANLLIRCLFDAHQLLCAVDLNRVGFYLGSKMNLKFLVFRKILFAIVFVISLGFAGYLVSNNISQRGIEKSFAKQVISTSTVGKSSQLQTLLNEIVAEEKIPGAVMYISTLKGFWLGASGVNNL
jgi:hypothetical protein